MINVNLDLIFQDLICANVVLVLHIIFGKISINTKYVIMIRKVTQ